MKTCAYCSTKVQDDEGRKDEEGNFVCLECAGEQAAEAGTACPSCKEKSDEYDAEGVCPNCGHEKSDDEDEAEGVIGASDDSDEEEEEKT